METIIVKGITAPDRITRTICKCTSLVDSEEFERFIRKYNKPNLSKPNGITFRG